MDVRLPNLGEGVDSGSVVTLFVKEGDVITKGQTLLELENEKAVAPIPSPVEGRVTSLRVKPGDKVTVGQVLVTVEGGGGSASPSPAKSAERQETPPPSKPGPAPEPPEPAEEMDAEPPSTASQKAGLPPPAAPSLRKLAKDLGIDLSKVRGSEAGGRIVLRDVRQYIQRLQQLAFRAKKEVGPAAPAAEPVDFARWGPVSSKPLSSLRQVISRRMTESWTTIPHVTQFDEADLTRINQLRQTHAPAYEGQGSRLTVTSFILKAVVAMLRKHPTFNASLDEAGQKVVLKEYYHIGIAVDTEAGLLVPVIRDVDTKSLLQLSKELQDLADKGRERKLALDDMKGGTFTLSNQGGIGSRHFTPIINKPEVAILGIGRGYETPVVVNGQLAARWKLPLALSYDHRLIDGAHAARFMVDLVTALENFPAEDVKL
ncbi:MAG: dihydrolipoamide acetyltransferase family protein [Verrucomicrobiota bacterium]